MICFVFFSVTYDIGIEMATGSSQSAADEALRTTDEKANFQRLTRLLMRGGLALLREVFDVIHPPANLPAVLGNPTIKSKLQTLRRKRVLTHPEWDCLYNPPSGAYGKSTDFDITLLCKLLREVCNLTPSTGWDNLPNSIDHSREADVVRIKFYRNTIYGHNYSMEMTNAEFEKLWMEISEALLRIAGQISSAKRDEWKKAIENLSRDPLTPDAKEYVSELRLWYKKDMETKDEIEKLIERVDQHTELLLYIVAKLPLGQPPTDRPVEFARLPSESVNVTIPSEQSHAQDEGTSVGPSTSAEPQLSQHNRVCIPIAPEQPPTLEEEGTTAGPSTSTEQQTSLQSRPKAIDFWYVVCAFKKPLEILLEYLKTKLGVVVQGFRQGSLIITVSCSSLEVLEALWKDYRRGHLNEVVQDTLVTAEVLKELNLSEVKLKTIISEDEYKLYKDFFIHKSGNNKG